MRSMAVIGRAIVLGAGLAAAGCQTIPSNTGMPLEFSSAERPAAASAFPNFPKDPRILEEDGPRQLDAGEEKAIELERTAAGTSGALSVELESKVTGKQVRIKWKPMPDGTLEEYNNSARKQLAAYQAQKLFLDAEDWVVPTVVTYCVPLPKYVRETGGGSPNLKGTNCVLGTASIWLQNVTSEENLYDEQRFVSDPVYAYYMSNFNILTYLIDHSDPKRSNFLVSKEPDRRQVFSIDNGLAFGETFRNFFPSPWHVIFVAALRKDSIDRLRALQRKDLDSLGVVAQLERDSRRVLVNVPFGENLAPNKGVRKSSAKVQLGLTKAEIDGVWKRIQRLVARVDNGEIAVF